MLYWLIDAIVRGKKPLSCMQFECHLDDSSFKMSQPFIKYVSYISSLNNAFFRLYSSENDSRNELLDLVFW